MAERAIIILVPLAALLVPLFHYLPQVLRWRVRSRIYRWYGELALLERDVATRGGALPTEKWLADLDPSALTRVIVPRPLPPVVANTYSARVAGDEGITMLDAIECWIYQHGLRHMGEIELARGLVGLQGMTS